MDAFWASWGRLGRVLGAFWGVLGAAWKHLGASWDRLGASWARFGRRKNIAFPCVFYVFAFLGLTGTSCLSFRLEGVLGASWEHRRRVLGPSWTVMVASWGVLWPSWGVLWASWGRLGLPKTSQDRSKTPPRRLPRRAPTSVQHRAILASPGKAKIMENVMPGAL